jgi:hypothetical protein
MSSTPSTITENNYSPKDVEAQMKDLTLSATPTLCGDIDEPKGTSISGLEAKQDVQQLSPLRKSLILAVLSCAQFFDIFNACAAIIALPTVRLFLWTCAAIYLPSLYFYSYKQTLVSTKAQFNGYSLPIHSPLPLSC